MISDRELRSLATPVERMSPERREEIKNDLLDVVRDERGAHGTPRWRRRAAGAAVAVAVVAGAGSAAAALGLMDRPDPEQVAAVNATIGTESLIADAHLDGWRPPLMAEHVECRYPSGTLVTPASDHPMEDLMTETHLVDACVDAARGDGAYGAESPTAESVNMCTTSSPGARPVALVDGSECSNHEGLLVFDANHLATLNQLRALDVAFLAVPAKDGCPERAEAVEWVSDIAAQSPIPLAVHSMDMGEDCYRGTAEWHLGTVTVHPVG